MPTVALSNTIFSEQKCEDAIVPLAAVGMLITPGIQRLPNVILVAHYNPKDCN